MDHNALHLLVLHSCLLLLLLLDGGLGHISEAVHVRLLLDHLVVAKLVRLVVDDDRLDGRHILRGQIEVRLFGLLQALIRSLSLTLRKKKHLHGRRQTIGEVHIVLELVQVFWFVEYNYGSQQTRGATYHLRDIVCFEVLLRIERFVCLHVARQVEQQSLVLCSPQSQLAQSGLLFVFGGEDRDLRLVSPLNLERERTGISSCVLLERGNERRDDAQHRRDLDFFKHRAECSIPSEASSRVQWSLLWADH